LETPVDILYLLIPISIVLVFVVIGLFWWALQAGQFDNIEREGDRILDPD
jgi:cbb3-type cytochrome oxidase maturation protein